MSVGASGAGIVHVVAGVLSDARGRILLARRTAGRDLAGAWEFPGGKVEPGETPFQALDRELHEELGIRIHAIEPLIAVPQQYHAKRIVLDVYRVSKFSGKPRGLEHQALAWSPPEKLHTYPMPPADRPVVAALTQSPHYLITPLAPELPLGASSHDLAQLLQAEAHGADFAVLGPVAATPDHPDATPLGWDGFAALREAVSLPIYALGGMHGDDVATARRHGGQGIAAIRGLWPA